MFIEYLSLSCSHAGLNWNAVPTMVSAPNPPLPPDLESKRKPPKKRQELPPKKSEFKWCIYIALLSKALYVHYIHPFTHTFIHRWRRKPCKAPTAHREQCGVQSLAQGHFDINSGGARIRTGNPSGFIPFVF